MASEQNHPWCRDVSRDEAIRAAEDAAAAERTPLPDHRDLPAAVAELRERVARLTTKHNALVDLARLDAGWVKTQEDCLAAERDAAIRERDAALARVAVLRASPAAKAGGEGNSEPVAWGVKSAGEITQVALLQWRDSLITYAESHGGTVVPLYAAPQPPRGWLTEEEREAVEMFIRMGEEHDDVDAECRAAMKLRAIIARSTPPAGGEVE